MTKTNKISEMKRISGGGTRKMNKFQNDPISGSVTVLSKA
jgi:hypothetical protein